MDDRAALLDDLRVIELASMVMVPSAAAVLADFGARVIKVEPPLGDLNRRGHHIPGMPDSEVEYCFLPDNRNKRSIVVDLKQPSGAEVFRRLVADADVLVTNYRMAALERLDLDWQRLRELNPRLILAHGTGYGDEGPESDKPGYDAVCYWSRSAIEATMFPIDGWLSPMPYGSGDHPSGMSLVVAILLALRHRERTGRGTRVSTSLLANGVWSNANTIQARLVNAHFHERRPREDPRNFAAVYYRCKEGRPFKFAVVDHVGTWPRFCKAAGRADLVEDPRYATPEARSTRMGELVRIFDQAFAEHPLEHWKWAFHRHDVPFSPVSTYDDVVFDEQLEANGVFVEVDHPRWGRLRTIDTPLRIEDCEKVPMAPPPQLGEHTRQILEESGFDRKTIERLIAGRVVLER